VPRKLRFFGYLASFPRLYSTIFLVPNSGSSEQLSGFPIWAHSENPMTKTSVCSLNDHFPPGVEFWPKTLCPLRWSLFPSPHCLGSKQEPGSHFRKSTFFQLFSPFCVSTPPPPAGGFRPPRLTPLPPGMFHNKLYFFSPSFFPA